MDYSERNIWYDGDNTREHDVFLKRTIKSKYLFTFDSTDDTFKYLKLYSKSKFKPLVFESFFKIENV